MTKPALALTLAGLLALPFVAAAHGDSHHGGHNGPVVMEQKPWGIAGQAKAVKRTIEVKMTDDMRFTPREIEVRQGETIRFIHHNSGKVMHEFVLGTRKELEEHAELMKKFPDMEHDEPYMAHVAPGKTAEMIWHFNRVGEFEFACLLPGHFEAGMIGKIRVVRR
ncbi:plastocyanin/azurin family copper-binding protein [Caldimonas sp.]|uniref:cupredoxin domain-containing protein n=1 Tax=Caldimonas sp. TaxID=2838790 RepID=UPI00391B397D